MNPQRMTLKQNLVAIIVLFTCWFAIYFAIDEEGKQSQIATKSKVFEATHEIDSVR